VVNPSRFVEGDDDEASSSSDLNDNGEELWVGRAEARVVRVAGDFHILEAALTFGGKAVHVAKLGRTTQEEKQEIEIATLFLAQNKFFKRSMRA
jgi:hypothetical protein